MKKKLEPCPHCLSLNVPEPKLSSHVESECNYKSGKLEWKPKREGAPPQAAITSRQEEPETIPEAATPEQSEAARENAVRSACDYLQDKFPPCMSVGSNSATILGRVSAKRHDARNRREEAIAK